MQAAPAPTPRRLPGRSAVRVSMVFALLGSANSLVWLVAPVLGANISPVGQGWHLRSPLLQWALTTPAGNLSQVALSLLVSGPAFVLLAVWVVGREVAQASDVTGLRPAAWPRPRPFRFLFSPGRGWLGSGLRQRLVSLALLMLAVLLAIALAVVVCASFYVLVRGPDLRGFCSERYGCPPVVPPSRVLFAASTFPLGLLLLMAAYIYWLRRVERVGGVWFRYGSTAKGPLVYVRQPEVTPEAAKVALARVSSVCDVPLARTVFFGVLLAILALLPWCATCILLAWLPYQWLPG